MASFRSLLRKILHLQESPHRTALAFAIGTGIAFCPFYGFHTLLAVFCTWAFGLNFLAVFAGALINNPWTIVPILGATYWTGATLMGQSDSPSFDWHDLSFSSIYAQVMPYAVPFALGGMVLTILGAALSYPAAYYFICKYRHRHPGNLAEPLPPPDPLR